MYIRHDIKQVASASTISVRICLASLSSVMLKAVKREVEYHV